MRVRAKITLIQSLILSGFLISMAVVMVRFTQADRLKSLELRGIEALTEIRTLEKKTLFFTSRQQSLQSIWDDWFSTFTRLDYYYTDLLTNPNHRLLGPAAMARRDSRYEAWTSIKEEEITPLILQLEQLLDEGIGDLSQDNGIRITMRLFPEDSRIQELMRLDEDFNQLRYSLVSSILIPSEVFVSDLRERVEQFTSTIAYAVMLITLVIQVGGAILGFRFSRRLGERVATMERALSKVAEGNFSTDFSIQSGDELELISRRFKRLTSDLWNRLDSMKDMLRDIGGSAGEGMEMDELLEFMLELAIDNTGADSGILYLTQKQNLVLTKHQGYFPPPMPLPPMVANKREYVVDWFRTLSIPLGEGFLGSIALNGEPYFVRDNQESILPNNADIQSDLYINSAIFLPLTVSGSVIGLLGLALTQQNTRFTDLDYAYMRSYSEFISLTIDNMRKYMALVESHRLNREIEVAADIQKALLPERMPRLPGAEVHAFSDAAKGVSGDYYDVFELGHGKTAIVVCDVAGKGVPASLLMIMIRTVLRSVSSPGKRADRILHEVNTAITKRLRADRFATISLIILDLDAGIVSYSNGAHHPLYILRGDTGRFRMFDTDGLPLGIDANASYGHKKIKVASGDYLVMFTDGLSEARDGSGEELGIERLLTFIARNSQKSPQELSKTVKDFLTTYTAGQTQHDDQTFLALKVG